VADFIPFEHDKGPVGVGQTLSIRRHDEGTPRTGTSSYGACPASGQAQDKMRCDSRSGCSTPPMAAAIWCSELN
jgi:hypothetical protein